MDTDTDAMLLPQRGGMPVATPAACGTCARVLDPAGSTPGTGTGVGKGKDKDKEEGYRCDRCGQRWCSVDCFIEARCTGMHMCPTGRSASVWLMKSQYESGDGSVMEMALREDIKGLQALAVTNHEISARVLDDVLVTCAALDRDKAVTWFAEQYLLPAIIDHGTVSTGTDTDTSAGPSAATAKETVTVRRPDQAAQRLDGPRALDIAERTFLRACAVGNMVAADVIKRMFPERCDMCVAATVAAGEWGGRDVAELEELLRFLEIRNSGRAFCRETLVSCIAAACISNDLATCNHLERRMRTMRMVPFSTRDIFMCPVQMFARHMFPATAEWLFGAVRMADAQAQETVLLDNSDWLAGLLYKACSVRNMPLVWWLVSADRVEPTTSFCVTRACLATIFKTDVVSAICSFLSASDAVRFTAALRCSRFMLGQAVAYCCGACRRLDVACALVDAYMLSADEIRAQRIFYDIARNGYIAAVSWLAARYPEVINISALNSGRVGAVFSELCNRGCTNMAVWFISNLGITQSHCQLFYVLCLAASRNHINTVVAVASAFRLDRSVLVAVRDAIMRDALSKTLPGSDGEQRPSQSASSSSAAVVDALDRAIASYSV